MRLGHTGVSTKDHDTTVQLKALEAADCDKLF